MSDRINIYGRSAGLISNPRAKKKKKKLGSCGESVSVQRNGEEEGNKTSQERRVGCAQK